MGLLEHLALLCLLHLSCIVSVYHGDHLCQDVLVFSSSRLVGSRAGGGVEASCKVDSSKMTVEPIIHSLNKDAHC